MPAAEFRFYEEPNDYLSASRRKRSFTHTFAGAPAIKDIIEALGAPHTEIDLIIVDGRSVRFSHRLRGGERVAVYPMFERFDIRSLHKLRPKPLRRTRFVADVHLGRLARYLRLLGFDTLYSRKLDDRSLVAISVRERRILLTRDVGLLKHRMLTRGYWVRTTDSDRQVEEIVHAFSLKKDLRPFHALYELQCSAASSGARRSGGSSANASLPQVSPIHVLRGLRALLLARDALSAPRAAQSAAEVYRIRSTRVVSCGVAMAFVLTSAAFADNGAIPKRYTCGGAACRNLSKGRVSGETCPALTAKLTSASRSSRRFRCHQMMPKGARRSEHEASLQSACLPRMSNHSEFVTDFPQQTPAPFDVRFLLNTLWA